jgi:hypothetical protein
MSMAALTLASDRLAACAASFEGANAAHLALRTGLQQEFAARQASMAPTFHVTTGGNDAHAGTAAAPLRSVREALSRTPVGGTCLVMLPGDYVLGAPHAGEFSTPISNKRLILSGPSSFGTPRPRLSFAPVAGSLRARHHLGLHGAAMVWIRGLTLEIPACPAATPAATYGGAIFETGTDAHGITDRATIQISYCDIDWPVDQTGALILHSHTPLTLIWVSNVMIGAVTDHRGRLISGRTTATASATLPWLTTNLAEV